MRICHVNYYSASGGAAVAAMRLHLALKNAGADSLFLAPEPQGNPDVIPLGNHWQHILRQFYQRLVARSYRLAHSSNFSGHGFELFRGGLIPGILSHHPDIVHLHSIVGEMMSIVEIAELCRSVPVVWTFHDAWPYTGTEQYYIPGFHPRYRTGYLPDNNDSQWVDFDRFYWNLKRKYWKNIPCHIISPSRYLAQEIQNSQLFKGYPVEVIPHGIDTRLFSPGNREQACKKLGLSPAQKYIGIAAVDFENFVKGGDILAEFQKLFSPQKSPYRFLIAGKNPPGHLSQCNHLICTGFLPPDKMPLFYQSLELFFNPTRMESFGLTNLEAMACGIPVLSSMRTAIPEVVQHKSTGYLCDLEHPADFMNGFHFIQSYRDELKQNARKNVLQFFQSEQMAERHMRFYENVLSSLKQ